MPSQTPALSRRRVLVGAAALAALGTAAACGTPAPKPDLGALLAQVDRARADARLAAAAATAAPPPVAASLTTIAAERTAHAQAVSDELERIGGASASTTSPSSPTSSPGTPPPPPAVKDVVAALKQSADSAAQTAAQQSGYRAGLLGSIAAACTTAYAVALGAGQPS